MSALKHLVYSSLISSFLSALFVNASVISVFDENCFCKAHKILLEHRNLWNDGVDCCRAVMVVSKQGQDSEWQGVSVLSVYVFVARHRLCVSLSDCRTVGGYACVAAHWYVWVPFCPLCVSVCVDHRYCMCDAGLKNRPVNILHVKCEMYMLTTFILYLV